MDGQRLLPTTSIDLIRLFKRQHPDMNPSTLDPVLLTGCNLEPIHIPGAIPPHGELLVIEESSLLCLQTSENLQDICGASAQNLINHSIDELFGPEADEPIATYVRDNGIGIRSKHYHAIFDIFRRPHAHSDFERLGSRIWLESQLGSGSTFYFTLG